MIDHNKLRVKIAESGKTQKEIAERLGSAETYVSKLANNDSNPRSSTLFIICDVLGIKAEDIRK